METLISQPLFDSMSSEVSDFAKRRGLEDVLDTVTEMTADVFGNAVSLNVEVGADPEVTGLNWIVFRMAISRDEIAAVMARRRDWSQRLFDVCPAEKVCEFQLQFDWTD